MQDFAGRAVEETPPCRHLVAAGYVIYTPAQYVYTCVRAYWFYARPQRGRVPVEPRTSSSPTRPPITASIRATKY
jgi:hypothetical protein